MFAKIVICTMIAVSSVMAKIQLRRGFVEMIDTIPELEEPHLSAVPIPDFDLVEDDPVVNTNHRLLQQAAATTTTTASTTTAAAAKGTLTVTNNCGKEITHMKMFYNVNWKNTGTQWSLQHQTYSNHPNVIPAQGSITIDGVNVGSEIHFYGITALYDMDQASWSVTETAYSDEKSDMWSKVTFRVNQADVKQFDIYVLQVGSDLTMNLCTETVVPPEPEEIVSKALTLHNNCGTWISHFRVFYNVYQNAATNWETQYDVFNAYINDGQSVSIPDVDEGTKLHFYGLKAFWDYGKRERVITEVVKGPEKSNRWGQVNFNQIKFDIYMTDFGDNWYLELCPGN